MSVNTDRIGPRGPTFTGVVHYEVWQTSEKKGLERAFAAPKEGWSRRGDAESFAQQWNEDEVAAAEMEQREVNRKFVVVEATVMRKVLR